jgi:hypothetical protein
MSAIADKEANKKTMKKNILLLLLLPLWGFAQKELWGVDTGDQYGTHPATYPGKIIKFDINGENPTIVHNFDYIQGENPLGRLFLASNGKLYGTTIYGGATSTTVTNTNAGVLYEYDLIFNRFNVVHYFGSNNMGYSIPEIGVIEPVQGLLVGATNNRIYKYNIATGTITFSNPLLFANAIHGELMKASNGFVYGTSYAGNCQSTSSPEPFVGNIIKYNLATNNVIFAHSIGCGERLLKGAGPNTELIELNPGKLVGVTRYGGIYDNINPLSCGTLFEFDINTNIFTKKIDFNGLTIGGFPRGVINGGNGKIFGLCESGGIDTSCSFNDAFGTLYEYTPATNNFEIKKYFNSCINNDFSIRYPQFIIKTSVGHFIGGDFYGNIFKYETTTNTVTRPSFGYQMANLIEICRKPSYQEIVVNTFDTCVGGTFTYDIQNTNATSYQWQQNGIDVAGQTTGVLNLTNIATSDAGNYTCVMTNECGTTTTMVLHLTVNCLGTTTIANFEESVKLYPNPTNGVLNIDLPANIDVNITSLKVIDLLGQEILVSNTNTTKIDVSYLPIGIYILSLQTNYGTWNGKFIKH